MAIRDLTVRLIGEDKTGSAVKSARGNMAKFGPAVAAGATVAAAGLLKFGKDSVAAFAESEQASLRLDEALKKFPATSDRSRESFDRLNEALAKKTRFDDDATASGQAVLAQFKLTGAQIQELTPLLQDYAAKTGKTLPDAALDLGKAVQGQGRALKAVGLNLKDTGTATGNLDALTAGLRKQVGGFAEAEGKTAQGAAAILGNRFGEVQEKVGAKLVPALTSLGNKLITVIDFLERNQRVVVPLVAVLGTLAGIIVTITAAAKVYTAVQTALNIVLTANPIGLVVVAIGALVAGLVIAYKRSETFRDIVNGALTAVRQGFQFLATTALAVVDKVLLGYQTLAEGAGKLPGPLGAPFRAAAGAIDTARGKLRELSAGIDSLGKKKATPTIKLLGVGQAEEALLRLEKRITNIGGVQVAIPGARTPVGFGVGGAQARAGGGPVVAGRPYLVGEREPELFVPNTSGRILNGAQMGGVSKTYQLVLTAPLDRSVTTSDLEQMMRRMELLG